MNANEIYNLPVQSASNTFWWSGYYYNHFPDIIGIDSIDVDQHRVAEKVVFYFDFDGRRNWRLTTWWIDDKPFMITQNAGREGDDHARRFITDIKLYQECVAFLNSLMIVEVVGDDIIDPEKDDPDLTSFYGNELYGHFEGYYG